MNLLKEIQSRFSPVLVDLVDQETLPSLLAMIRPSQDGKFGDYQANCAMPLSKRLGKSSREVAELILQKVDLQGLASATNIAGPGFINITIADELLNSQLQNALGDLDRLGIAATDAPRKIVIDFASPNVAKPMHVGHIRSTVIGDSLSRILRFVGHDVITDNHLGDWGTQFGMIIYGYKHFLNQQAYDEQPVTELSRLYRQVRLLVDYHAAVKKLPDAEQLLEKQKSLITEFKNTDPGDDKKLAKKLKKDIKSLTSKIKSQIETLEDLQKTLDQVPKNDELAHLANEHANIGKEVLTETAKLHEGDAKNKQLWNEFMVHGQYDMQRVFDRLQIEFDHVLGESFYHDQLGSVAEDLTNKSLARESEGALCVFLEDNTAPMIVRKSDGAFLYATTDLATVKYRMEQWNPDSILYVVDFRQGEHFDKLFAVSKLWGYQDVELNHVKFGTVMGKDGKPYKTRAGNAAGLEPLLDDAEAHAFKVVSQADDAKPNGPEFDESDRKEIAKVVGIAALKYADLSTSRTSDYVFSFEKMCALNGNTATYLQYGYARVNGIFRKGDIDPVELRNAAQPFQFAEDVERLLALKLLRFAEALDECTADYRPNLLCNYLFELTQTFFVFFNQCPVLKSEGELKQSRLQFCDLMARTLKQGLSLLGINVLQKM